MFEQSEWPSNAQDMPDPVEIRWMLHDLRQDIEQHKRFSDFRFSSLEQRQVSLERRPCSCTTADTLGGALSFLMILIFGAILGAAGAMIAITIHDQKRAKGWEESSYDTFISTPSVLPERTLPEAVQTIKQRAD